MPLTIYQVDAFTRTPFSGNPAGVCILTEPAEPDWMQAVAREMNLSETAFLHREKDGYNLRWFTPAVEVDLCGHATLASAHILWETEQLSPDETAVFHTRSGKLTAVKTGERIEMDFPATLAEPAEDFVAVVDALDVRPLYAGKSRFDYLIEVEAEDIVRNLTPDFSRLKETDARGVIVTSRSGSDAYDFVSRFFAPRVGVDEDPVTGSAHCCLGPYWQGKLEKDQMVGYQASPRGGTVHVRVEEDRVHLGGDAVTVMVCELRVDV